MRSGVTLGASIVLATFAAAEPSLRQPGPSPARALDAGDRAFAAAAASSARATVETSRLALLRASAPVQALAQQVQQDVEKRQADLAALFVHQPAAPGSDQPAAPGSDPPLTAERQQMHHQLAMLEGPAFDSAYLQQMLADQRGQLARFERHAREGSDARLKSFAEKTVPALHAHLRLAEARAKRLGDDGGAPLRR